MPPDAGDGSRFDTGRQDVTSEIERLSQAERMLAEIATAGDAVNVIAFAEAARVWAQQAKLGTTRNGGMAGSHPTWGVLIPVDRLIGGLMSPPVIPPLQHKLEAG